MTIPIAGSFDKLLSQHTAERPTQSPRTVRQLVLPSKQPLGIALMMLLALMPRPKVLAETTPPIQADSVLIRLIDQVEVPARAVGVLSAIHATEGQVVEKGMLLAQIDDEEARLIGQRAKIEFKIASENAKDDVAIRSAHKAGAFNRSEHERLKRAASELSGSVLKSELEEAALRYEQARLDLERAQRDLHLTTLAKELKQSELLMSAHHVKRCQIKAPLGGVVVEVLRRPGEWVESGDKVVRIVRLDRLRAEGFVLARDLSQDMVGASATVSADVPGKPPLQFAGEVVFINPEINPVSGQVRVWVEVDNPRRLLKPGMRVTMTIASPPQRDRRQEAAERESRSRPAEPGGTWTLETLQVDSRP